MFIPLYLYKIAVVEKTMDCYSVIDQDGVVIFSSPIVNFANMFCNVENKKYMKEHSNVYVPRNDGTITKDYCQR